MSDIRICLKNIAQEDLIGIETYGTGTDFDIVVLHYSHTENNIVVSRLHKVETSENGFQTYDGNIICVVGFAPTKTNDGYDVLYRIIIYDEKDKDSPIIKENEYMSVDIVNRYQKDLIKYYENNIIGRKVIDRND